MNFWTPTWYPWNEKFSDADLPWEVKYDFVETYTWNSHTGGFDFYWKDDFSSFDNSKWYMSDNWGFEGNSSLFVTSQVSNKDGNLVLTLDKAPTHSEEDSHFLHYQYPPHGHDKYAPLAPIAHHKDEEEEHAHDVHKDVHFQDDWYDMHAYHPLVHHEHAAHEDPEHPHSYTEGHYQQHDHFPTHQTAHEYW